MVVSGPIISPLVVMQEGSSHDVICHGSGPLIYLDFRACGFILFVSDDLFKIEQKLDISDQFGRKREV